MAGIFSLGGNGSRESNRSSSSSSNPNPQNQHPYHQLPPPPNLFFYRYEDNPQKVLELWPQYYQNPAQNVELQLQNQWQGLYSSAGEVVHVGPSNHGGLNNKSDGVCRSMRRSSGESVSCQDCGNQAKKDCKHTRCRACCKSRGFDCLTHVKSTWVPAAKRREKQQQQYQQHQQLYNQQQQQIDVSERANPKRQRENQSTSGLQVGHFPAEVNTEAVFRCVRVSSMDDREDQYAYQTAVNINGHMFKGILHDEGPESFYNTTTESLSGGGSGSTTGVYQPNLPASTATTSPFIDPSMFPAQLNDYMAGTQFFPPPPS